MLSLFYAFDFIQSVLLNSMVLIMLKYSNAEIHLSKPITILTNRRICGIIIKTEISLGFANKLDRGTRRNKKDAPQGHIL